MLIMILHPHQSRLQSDSSHLAVAYPLFLKLCVLTAIPSNLSPISYRSTGVPDGPWFPVWRHVTQGSIDRTPWGGGGLRHLGLSRDVAEWGTVNCASELARDCYVSA